MNELTAFHNDPKIKQVYLDRVLAHQKADEIVKGVYWEGGKGCAVGCTVHSDQHRAYEEELGIPRWAARLEDRIFEGLPNDRAKVWPSEFLAAIKPGAKLSKLLIPMLIFIVESARESTDNERSLKAIDKVLKELKRKKLDIVKLRAARHAAAAAAAAAYVAADAAAADAAAAAAADAAYAAYAAAAAATYAADAAAADAADAADAAADADAVAAARSKQYVKFADYFLFLLKGCE